MAIKRQPKPKKKKITKEDLKKFDDWENFERFFGDDAESFGEEETY